MGLLYYWDHAQTLDKEDQQLSAEEEQLLAETDRVSEEDGE